MTSVRLKILDLGSFLKVLRTCKGDVRIYLPAGSCISILHEPDYEAQLWTCYFQSQKYLPLTLTIDSPKDHMAIVCYYSGDC